MKTYTLANSTEEKNSVNIDKKPVKAGFILKDFLLAVQFY